MAQDELEPLVARAVQGDRQAFSQLVRATSPRLLRLAARMVGSPEEAEDIVQEAYVRAHRALLTGRFDRRARVDTWLYRIVANASIDVLRQQRQRRPDASDQVPEVAWDGVASAEAHLALRELDDLLQELPPEQRAAMVLKSVEGLSSLEIAAILGCSEGAVEQKLVRARAALRQREDPDV